MEPNPAFNPYAAPESELASGGGRRLFQDLDQKTVKKLYHHSHTLITMSVLWSLGAIVCLVAASFAVDKNLSIFGLDPEPTALILCAQALLNIFAVIGCWKRPVWGRIVAMVATATSILSGAILAIIIGILVMIALAQGGRLFGPDRFLHSDLKTEFKYRKKNGIQ